MKQYYTDEQKRVAVDRYFDCGNSSQVIQELGYPSVSSLMKWVHRDSRYDLPATRHHFYDFDTKMAAVLAHLDEGKSLREVGAPLGVKASQVARWVRRYQKNGPQALQTPSRKGGEHSEEEQEQSPLSSEASAVDSELLAHYKEMAARKDTLRTELFLLARQIGLNAEEESALMGRIPIMSGRR